MCSFYSLISTTFRQCGEGYRGAYDWFFFENSPRVLTATLDQEPPHMNRVLKNRNVHWIVGKHVGESCYRYCVGD